MQQVETINPYNGDENKTAQVREMFDSIAPAYDLMNRLMSFGLHRRWLAKAVREVASAAPVAVLDVATGTADVAIAIARNLPDASVSGVDLSEGMIKVGREKVAKAGLSGRITLTQGDCMALDIPDNSFDAVTVAYGVRNFERLADGYREMLRVLRPGGKLTVIELSTPRNPIVKPFYKFYTRCVIPLVGKMVSKDLRAYSYLPESIAAVPQGHDMCSLMSDCGFAAPQSRSLTFGTCSIYTAIKPSATTK